MEVVKLMNMCKITDPSTGKALVIDRVKSWTGLAFPGGKIELGESIVKSTKREVFEETGLVVHDLELCGIKDWYDYKTNERTLIFLFKTNKFTGNLTSSCPEGDIYWLSEEEILNKKVAVDFDILLDVFNNPKVNELVYEDNGTPSEKTRWDLKLY